MNARERLRDVEIAIISIKRVLKCAFEHVGQAETGCAGEIETTSKRTIVRGGVSHAREDQEID